MIPQPRTAARVILVDSDERVLLMHELRDIGSELSHWITPGGGVEAGESLAEAAIRELYEETGISISIGPDSVPVYIEQTEFTFAGSTYLQTDHFFYQRCEPNLPVRPAGHTANEKLVVLGHRWWPLAEILDLAPNCEPAALVEIIRGRLAEDAR